MLTNNREKPVIKVGDSTYLQLSSDAALLLKVERGELEIDSAIELLQLRYGKSISHAELKSAADIVVEKLQAAGQQQSVRNPLQLFEIPLIPSRAVQLISGKLHALYSWPVAMMVVWLSLSLTIASFTMRAVDRPHDVAFTWPMAYVLFMLSLIAHEFGHTTALSNFGLKPRAIGLTAFLVFPAFYSDVSETWLLESRKRLVVDAGGTYFQLIPLTLMALIYLLTRQSVFVDVEVLILTTMAINLNPILRFDGYWMLADALDVPRPRAAANALLLSLLNQRNPAPYFKSTGTRVALLAYGAIDALAIAYFAYLAVRIGATRIILLANEMERTFLSRSFSVGAMSSQAFTFLLIILSLASCFRIGNGLRKFLVTLINRKAQQKSQL